MPSRVFSATVVYMLLAVFAARTLGDNQLNKLLKHSVGRRVQANVVGAHDIVRKQSENTCSTYSDEYYRRIAVLQCNADYIRAVREEIGKSTCDSFDYEIKKQTTCDSFHCELRQQSFYDCGTNHNGTFCAEFNAANGNISRYYSDFFDQCFFSSSGPPSADNCEIGCKLALQQLVNQIGCCIHASNYDRSDIILTPSLWESCDIQRPQPCSDTPQPIKAPDDVTLQCSPECLLRQSRYLYCKSLGKELETINRECDISPRDTFGTCGFDKGNYCNLVDILDDPASYFATVYDKCYTFFAENVTTDRVCSGECKGAVQEVKDRYGCCVEYYNISDITDASGQVMRSDLWVACGIDTLENCELGSAPDDYLDGGECDAGVTLHVSFTCIFIAVIVLLFTT